MARVFAVRPNAACWVTLAALAASLAASWIALQVEAGALAPRFFFAGLALLYTGLLLDGLDGYVARRCSLQSELGKHLDSLADTVTALVAPALFLRAMGMRDGWSSIPLGLLVMGGALRLAGFNIAGNTRSGDRWCFTGVPTFYSHFLLGFLCLLRWLAGARPFALLAGCLVTALALAYNLRIPVRKPMHLRTLLVLPGMLILGALVLFLLEVRLW